MALDMDKVCRVCLKSDAELYLIFDEKYSEESTNLARMLSECTMYQVNRHDELPHQICALCMQMTKSAFSFKRCCERSYRQLMDMLNNDSAKPSYIKLETNVVQTEKSTQTEDSTMYPCERCDEKFFTFDALRVHRENKHKGSAIVCRFCSKSFNRVGYLKTHIAVFHPESGYTSHNQCSICRRQFTRREHMRRHMAVIHKIVEMVEAPQWEEEEHLTSEMQGLLDEPEILDSQCEGSTTLEINVLAGPTNNGSVRLRNSSPSESEDDREDDRIDDGSDVKPPISDDEDEKPLSDFVGALHKNFVEVLIDECKIEDEPSAATVETFNTVKHDTEAPPAQISQIDSFPEQRSRRSACQQNATATESIIAENDNKKQFKCSKCEKKFHRQASLQRHRIEHAKDKAYQCNLCTKRFSEPDLLRNHINNVHAALKCHECNIDFTHNTQLKRHKETKHAEKMHPCDICQKSFSTKLYMQRHRAAHSKKRFMCKECSSRFMTRDELTAHIKAEGHDKPLLCPECGLRCKTSNILMVHMRRHKGEKPFKCKFCSKGFPRMDDLRIHEKYHTGEKSHFCETCGKGFQRKYNLTIHMRVHTGEKPYKCPHCPNAFTQSNDLKSHIRRHTGERFRCDICGAPFLQGYQMRQHKLAEHGVKDIPPTQRVEKYTSPEEQEQQIKQNMQREFVKTTPITNDITMEPLPSLNPACTNMETLSTEIEQTDMSFLNI